MENKISDDCIIYLSGPSSLDTPLDLLRSKCVFSVNGSAGYLMDNNVPIFAYVVCDGSFYKNNKSSFEKYSKYAKHTYISEDVLKRATHEEKTNLLSTCVLLKDLCKSRGGLGRKIRYSIMSLINKNIFIKCSTSRKTKTLAFSTDVTYGHFGSATVAFTALQIAITLKFKEIYFSGLDLNGKCERFYSEDRVQPTTLPSDIDFIVKSFLFLRQKYRGDIFNLSKKTAVPYDVIPFMNIDEIKK